MPNPTNITSFDLFERIEDRDRILFYSEKNNFKPYAIKLGLLRQAIYSNVDNGIELLSQSIGLGGELSKDTTIERTGNNFQIEDTSTNSRLILGRIEYTPGVFIPMNGILFDEGNNRFRLVGSINATSIGGDEELNVIYSDPPNGVKNGVVVQRDRVFFSVYRPDGTAQFGFNAFDGTQEIAECADHYAWDPALNLDISLVQTTMSHAQMRYAYDTTPGSEKFNRFTVDANGATLDSIQVILPNLGNYPDDATAASSGVPINGLYRNGNVIQIRVS